MGGELWEQGIAELGAMGHQACRAGSHNEPRAASHGSFVVLDWVRWECCSGVFCMVPAMDNTRPTRRSFGIANEQEVGRGRGSRRGEERKRKRKTKEERKRVVVVFQRE